MESRQKALDALALKGKLIAVPFIGLLIFTGRIVAMVVSGGRTFEDAAVEALLYALYGACLSYFVVDLVLARGFLQHKVTASKILLVALMLLIAGNLYVVPRIRLDTHQTEWIETAASVLLCVFLLWLDKRSKRPFLVDDADRLPAPYLLAHPLRTAMETVFRLFPNPLPIGLYTIGNPGDNAPVFVTGNYDLTVRRVAKKLRSLDCRLLVCDSRGVNIWCSTLADHFNEQDVIEAMRITGIAEKVGTKKLILPQLCAGNMKIKKIKEETGFTCVFGPAHIRDVQKYLDDKRNDVIRLVTFSLKERLEMGFATIIFPLIVLTLVFNFMDLTKLLILIPGVYVLSLLCAALYPVRPIKNIPLWSLVVGGCLFLSGFGVFTLLLELNYQVYYITLALCIMYSINEYEGWCPLVKYAMFSTYKMPQAVVDTEACIGCRRCVEVCPMGVYQVQHGKSEVAHLERCISCKSCYAQCPENAIAHSSENINNFLIKDYSSNTI